MAVIHIYGASGAGTTTLGKALGKELGYRLLDTDDYFWLPSDPPYAIKRDRQERIALLRHDLNAFKDAIISGSLCGWGDVFIPAFDLAVRLIVPQDIRLQRLEVREFQRFGSRLEAGGDMFAEHTEFMKWAAAYDTGDASMRSSAMHDLWLKQLTCKNLVLDGTQPVELLTSKIKEELVLLSAKL